MSTRYSVRWCRRPCVLLNNLGPRLDYFSTLNVVGDIAGLRRLTEYRILSTTLMSEYWALFLTEVLSTGV